MKNDRKKRILSAQLVLILLMIFGVELVLNQKKVKDRWNSQMHLKVSLVQAKQLKGKEN